MAPKGKKGSNTQKSKGGEEEREEPLQAVIFADAFETKFAPFTLEHPRCLLPLANTPLIEYTLEFLANAGVEEVILYCGNHTDQVEDYLKSSKWTSGSAPFSLEVIRSDARSVGDAMRDLDQKQLITGDFICVYGDVVANIAMDKALSAHRVRREKNKKAIMTMVLREAGDAHRTKSHSLRPVFVIDPVTERCVHYEQLAHKERPRLDIPGDVLEDHLEVEVREDLVDCGIDICTPEVLAQYSDNFDWQMPRRGFLYGVLKDFETFQLTVHTHVIDEGYAARVRNLSSYDAVTRDIVSRWSYPLCPDLNLVSDQSYQLQRGNVYMESGIVLARSSMIKNRSVLGKATSVGEGSVITNSVVGRRCVIGKRVKLDGAHIWDDVRVGDDAIIDKCIIANEAKIGERCHVQAGALISYAVNIGTDSIVKGSSKLTKKKRHHKRQQSGSSISKSRNAEVIVENANGQPYELEDDEDEDDLIEGLMIGDIYQSAKASTSSESISTLASDSEDDDIPEHHRRRSSRTESFASINSDESGETRKKGSDFHHEATISIVDALQKGDDADTIQLELQGLKLSSNAEDKQVRRAVAVSLVKRIAGLVESGVSPKDAVAKTIPPNQLIVKRCVQTGGDEYSDQLEFLLYLQTACLRRQQGAKILLFACTTLAHNDLIEAEGFEAWWEDPRSSASDELQAVRLETKPLIDVLVGDDDDDEESE